MYLSLDENKNVNFDEIMKNPSRGVRLINYNFLLDFGVGFNKSFSCRNNSEEKKRDFAIGIETGYTLGIPINGWNRGGIEILGTKNVSNGPDLSMSGPYVRFNIGSVGIGEK